jgi:hypothetical protein
VTDIDGPKPNQITCRICNNPIDLTQDHAADENGRAVHERCYIQRLLSSRNDPPDPNHAQ